MLHVILLALFLTSTTTKQRPGVRDHPTTHITTCLQQTHAPLLHILTHFPSSTPALVSLPHAVYTHTYTHTRYDGSSHFDMEEMLSLAIPCRVVASVLDRVVVGVSNPVGVPASWRCGWQTDDDCPTPTTTTTPTATMSSTFVITVILLLPPPIVIVIIHRFRRRNH
jgi:hypothetical protein